MLLSWRSATTTSHACNATSELSHTTALRQSHDDAGQALCSNLPPLGHRSDASLKQWHGLDCLLSLPCCLQAQSCRLLLQPHSAHNSARQALAAD